MIAPTFLFSCLFVIVSSSPAIEKIQISNRYVHGLIANDRLRFPPIFDRGTIRQKRQIDIDDDDDDDNDDQNSANCILRCANRLQSAAASIQNRGGNSMAIGNGKLMKPNFNMTHFRDTCTTIRPSIQCFNSCPRSIISQTVDKSLDLLRYICIDRYEDFLNNLRCMNKLETTSFNQCSPRCRRYETYVNQTLQLSAKPYLKYLYSVEQLRDMISGACQYIKCYMDCSVPITRRSCGQTAAELVSTTVQKMMASMQFYIDFNGAGDALPESCRRLAQTNDDDGEQNQQNVGRNEETDDSDIDSTSNRRSNDGQSIILVMPEED